MAAIRNKNHLSHLCILTRAVNGNVCFGSESIIKIGLKLPVLAST